MLTRDELIQRRKIDKAKATAKAMRQIARERGAKLFKGVPCKHGHDGQRFTSTSACVRCTEIRNTGTTRRRCAERRKGYVKPPYTREQHEALIAGRTERYYGKPCPKGHDGLRYKTNSTCVLCLREWSDENTPPSGLTRSERFRWKHARRLEVKAQRAKTAAEMLSQAVAHRKKQERIQVRTARARPVVDDLLFWIIAGV